MFHLCTRFILIALCIISIQLKPAKANGPLFLEQTMWVGPHINIVFAPEATEFSLGVEASYWHDNDYVVPFVGACIGTEYNFQKSKLVSYLQGQGGFGFLGGSFGAVYDQKKGFGIQTSGWANIYFGGIFHYRYFGPEITEDPVLGVYFKTLMLERE